MAEGLLVAALDEGSKIAVGSAGVAAMSGQLASRETTAILEDRGATLEQFKSRQVDQDLVKEADLIIAMSESHADVLSRLIPGLEVNLLTDFIDPEEGLQGVDVPDPYGMNQAAYEEVAEVIDLAIPGILKALDC